MMDNFLQQLADAPLADPNKINLPMGRRPLPRPAKEARIPEPGDLTLREVRERRAKEASRKVDTLLDYYARTDVPLERIAEHLKLRMPAVIRAMKERGRQAA
jgi:hypothetical protein